MSTNSPRLMELEGESRLSYSDAVISCLKIPAASSRRPRMARIRDTFVKATDDGRRAYHVRIKVTFDE